MTRDDFLLFADGIICNRVQNTSMRSYRNLMRYCENIYRECVGFNDNPLHGSKFADLICTDIANAFIAGTEEPRQTPHIVKCRDCVYSVDGGKRCDNAYLLNVDPDGFCAWGEELQTHS